MSFRKYAEYKESGVDWLGEVPEHWNTQAVWMGFELGRGRVISKGELQDNPGDYPVYSSQTEQEGEFGRLNTYDFDGHYITWTTDGAHAGTTFERRGKFNCTNVCGTLKSRTKELNLTFYRYAIDVAAKWYVRHDINPKLMNNVMASIRIPKLPLSEQNQIAAFLDKETTNTDILIDKQEQLITLLQEKRQAIISHAVTRGLNPNVKMKESGIEWLGEVPEHWEVTKLGYIAKKIGSGKTPRGGSEVYLREGILFLRSQNVHDTGLMLRKKEAVYISVEIDSEMSATRVKPGDILLNITGASIGRTCIVPANFPRANVNQHVCIIRVPENLQYYLSYFLKSVFVKSQIDAFQTGASREGLNFEQISKIFLCIPPKQEQNRIIAYLDKETAKIDTLIEKCETAIELLKERRTTLISAAVTGKIDVGDVG